MTAPLPARAANSRQTGSWYAQLLPRALAVFLALHGLVHVIGFTNAWGLGSPKGVKHTTLILNGSVDVGDAAMKALGFVWLAAVVAFLVVAVMVWRGHPWARRTTIVVVVASLVLCTIALPNAVIGLVIDVVLLALLAVASSWLIARPNGPARG